MDVRRHQHQASGVAIDRLHQGFDFRGLIAFLFFLGWGQVGVRHDAGDQGDGIGFIQAGQEDVVSDVVKCFGRAFPAGENKTRALIHKEFPAKRKQGLQNFRLMERSGRLERADDKGCGGRIFPHGRWKHGFHAVEYDQVELLSTTRFVRDRGGSPIWRCIFQSGRGRSEPDAIDFRPAGIFQLQRWIRDGIRRDFSWIS